MLGAIGARASAGWRLERLASFPKRFQCHLAGARSGDEHGFDLSDSRVRRQGCGKVRRGAFESRDVLASYRAGEARGTGSLGVGVGRRNNCRLGSVKVGQGGGRERRGLYPAVNVFHGARGRGARCPAVRHADAGGCAWRRGREGEERGGTGNVRNVDDVAAGAAVLGFHGFR